MEPLADRARQLYDLGRYEEAIEHYAKQLAQEPGDWHSMAMISLCELRLGHKDNALKSARRALETTPDAAFAHYMEGMALSHMGDVDGAIACMKRARRCEPETAHYATGLASVYAQAYAWRRVLRTSEEALRLDPLDKDAQTLRTRALAALGKRREAFVEAEHALTQDPESAEAFATNGHIALHHGDHRDAIEFFAEALRLDPMNADAREGIHQALRCLFPPFRWLLRAGLGLEGVHRGCSWLAGFGVFFLVAMFGVASIAFPALRPIGVFLWAAFWFFVAMSFVGKPVIDFFLLAHPRAGQYFDGVRRRELLVVGAAFLLAAVGCLIAAHDLDRGFSVFFLPLGWLFVVARMEDFRVSTAAMRPMYWYAGLVALASGVIGLFYPWAK